MIGICESLIYAHKAGLDEAQIVDLLKDGGAQSYWLRHEGPRMLERDFTPGFFVEHFVKDLGLALEESKKMNAAVPGTALAYQMY